MSGRRPATRDVDRLPLDPDAPERAPRPLHLRAAAIALVAVGGTLGTAAREGLTLLLPAARGIPVAILTANLAGAFLLGLLLEALARSGPHHGHRRRLRLLAGTGFMGGFTTYSTLAVGTVDLLGDGRIGLGLTYGLATVLLGALATWAGIAAGAIGRGRRGREGGR